MQQEPVAIPEVTPIQSSTSSQRKYHFNFPLMISYPLQVFGLNVLATPLERIQVVRQCAPGLAALGQNYSSNGAVISGRVISD